MNLKRILKIGGIVASAMILASIARVALLINEVRNNVSIGGDQVKVWDEQVAGQDTYLLARITTGFQEQGEEIAVFKGRITYNRRHEPLYDNAILREHLDQRWDERGRETRRPVRGTLDLGNNRIEVFFDDAQSQTFPISLTDEGRQWYRHDPGGSPPR